MKVMRQSVRLYWIAALLLAACGSARGGPIHDAARKGDQRTVAALLASNPDLVSSRDKMGYTPLHLAALHDQTAVATLLLADGADVNARIDPQKAFSPGENFNETPLSLALSSYHHKEMLELLLTHGADPNVYFWDGLTPLLRAIDESFSYEVELLLANGADPNVRDGQGRNSLHHAVFHSRVIILENLLRYGASVNQKDNDGFTPLYYAGSYGNKKAAVLLRSHGGS